MASPFNVFDWYWDVLDTLHGTHVYSSKAEAFVVVSNADYIAWLGMFGGNSPIVASTIADLGSYLNNTARNYFTPAFKLFDVFGDLVLTNFLINSSDFLVHSSTPKKLTLPPALSPKAAPIGTPLTFTNVSDMDMGWLDVYLHDGTTLIGRIYGGGSIRLILKNNLSSNGVWELNPIGNVYYVGPVQTPGNFAIWVEANRLDQLAAGDVLFAIGGQPLDPELTALSAITGSTDAVPYWTGPGAMNSFFVQAPMRTALNAASTGIFLNNIGAQPLDADLTSLAAASATNAIYYRTAANTWATVTIGANLTFTAGTLAATGGGGGISEPTNDGLTYGRKTASGTSTWNEVVPKAGGTFTGDLTIAPSSNVNFFLDAPISNQVSIAGRKAGVNRWALSLGDTTAEAAGNVGSNFFLRRFSNAGTVIDDPISIVRSTGAVTIPNLVGYAPLASPTFTGDPKAPTPTAGDSDTSIATTAFVGDAITNWHFANVTPVFAPLSSPTFTGDPKAPTPAVGDADTSVATTAFVKAFSDNLSTFRVTLSANQTGITQNTFTKVTFNTAGVNIGSNFNTTNNRWTPPAGRVQLGLQISGIVSTSVNVYAAIYKNGTTLGRAYVNSGSSTIIIADTSIVDVANGTDFYEAFTMTNATGGMTVDATAIETFFWGARI